MIIVNDKTIAVWHFSLEGDFDYLAALYRNETNQLMFTYRFIHADAPDTAHWYSVGPPKDGCTDREFENIMASTIRMIEGDLGRRADEIRMKNGDVEAFCEELLARPYIGVRAADTNTN
jgi:hypothetical protein